MTISPPSKVDRIPAYSSSILASGVDTLDLAIDVIWKDESFFEYLSEMKALAQQEEKEVAITLGTREGQTPLLLAIKPHGNKGHEWVLHGNDYSLTIGNWLKPKTRHKVVNAQINPAGLHPLRPCA